jgi:AcrR family transcriptional regulator
MKQEAFHSPKSRRQRVNDPDGTKRNIIDVATEEFSAKGFSGARVDKIAARTKTSKRMIYYYFGGKEGLYIAVLEAAYRSIRSIEAALDLEKQTPEEALRALISFTFDYQNAHPEFVRHRYLARPARAWPASGGVSARCRPRRPAYVHQRLMHFQCRQSRHLLHYLQTGHGISPGASCTPGPGDRHHSALSSSLISP